MGELVNLRNRFHLLQEILLIVNMAKEKHADPEKAARKAEKRAKKEAKRADKNGVHKSKKEKKSKEVKPTAIEDGEDDMKTTTKLLKAIEKKEPISEKVQDEDEQLQVKEEVLVKENTVPLVGALVPFADPLVKDKSNKKVLKGIKKGECISSPQHLGCSMGRLALERKILTRHYLANKNGALKRGVKEVVKAVRKSPIPPPTSTERPSLICILAADISPMDVISHIPVLCEDHNIPYVFVTSRADLGAASNTKRPTSVVLIARQQGRKRSKPKGKKGESRDEEMKDVEEEKEEDWGALFNDLLKVVEEAPRSRLL